MRLVADDKPRDGGGGRRVCCRGVAPWPRRWGGRSCSGLQSLFVVENHPHGEVVCRCRQREASKPLAEPPTARLRDGRSDERGHQSEPSQC